jgi:ketosteroid isomerase-like protein
MRTALSVLLACIACAPLPKQSETVVPARSNRPRIEDAIRTAQSTFDSAAQAGDAHRMAGLFDDDAVLITPASDTIRGKSAIERLLTAAQPGATGAKFWFAREPPLEHCRDGGYEHAQFTAEIRQGDGSKDTLRARFVVLWNRDSIGSARVKRVSFPERELSGWPTRAECVTDIQSTIESAKRLQESSRLSITLVVGHTTGDPSQDFELAMKSRGWSDVAYTCPSSRPCDYLSTHSYRSTTNPIVPLLRYRFSKELAMEMLGGALLQGATIGVDTAAGSQMELLWSGAYAGVLLSYELAGLQLGIGPAVQTVHWHVDDHYWPYNASTFYQSSFHSNTVGLIADIGGRLRMPSRLHLDAHGESRWFGRMDVRGSPRFPTVNVRNNSTFLGLGLGWAF